nr:shikimate kinase [Planctomycetota bacterium]
MTSRLVLVGYRASGKSTVGRAAARRLGWRFVDSDQRLESELGPIAAFFAAHGEAEFRRRESACLAALLAETGPQVLATGGGIVLVESNRTALRT